MDHFISFFALITIFLSIYNYAFLAFLMLIKIFPKRKELQNKSQYISIFDITIENQPGSKNRFLYYLDLIVVCFFLIIILTIPIYFSTAIGIQKEIIVFLIIYSISTFFIIFNSKINNLEKFYIDLSRYKEPLIFIRTKDKIIQNLFKYMSRIMWSIIIFWSILGVVSLIIN